MELELREFDRCRMLYERFLEYGPDNCTSWCRYAELESLLGDLERARGIYEIAIAQPRLDMPEVIDKFMVISSFRRSEASSKGYM